LKLKEKGLLDLNDPVEKYVPIALRAGGEQVRIWHLLTHTSGIPALAYAEAYIRSSVGDDKATWLPISSHDDMFTFLKDASSWAVDSPGKSYYYLNEGYVLLGYIIEKVSGLKYEDFVKRNILEPLNMDRSFFSKDEVEKDPDVATPYVVDKDGKIHESRYPFGITSDGGLLSNAEDMANYVSMLIDRGRFNDIEIVSRESVEEAEKEWVQYPYSMVDPGSRDFYGLGLRITPNFFGRKLVSHGGSVLVYTAYMGYIPSEKIGVNILLNTTGYPPWMIGLYALTLLLGRDPEAELKPLIYDRVLDKVCGDYATYKNTMNARVERKGSILVLRTGGRFTGYEIPIIPERVDRDYIEAYTLNYGSRVGVRFYIKDGVVELIYERYKFVKKS
jgi:CubicO group peptidase (beta-lactamase class C family)